MKRILSENFIQKLKELTIGYMSGSDFDLLISKFESELSKNPFTPSSEANLLRVIFSLYDKISFLIDCLKYPHYLQIISAIVTNSNYLTDVIVRSPELLYWIVNEDNLNQRLNSQSLLKSVRESLGKFKTFNAKVNNLRLIKNRELLRIGVNDILGNTNLNETTGQLSVLAKVINSELFLLCHKEIELKYNIEIKTVRYCLAALGKLGGDELNYSSDIDLILFFDKNTVVCKKPVKEYFEILSETAQLYVQTSTAKTDKGYLYRVDFRLRPDGRTSFICRTLKDYLQYYETRGEDWERQMLIKVSFAGGNKKLYESFHNYILHFVYPSSFSVSPLRQIASIKADIENKVAGNENIKLFSGGIRDIEFSVQALQLLNGGSNQVIRSANTLYSISILTQQHLLTEDEALILNSAYDFYRKIEHYLQLMNDQQTHIIPQNPELLFKLTVYFKFKTPEVFRKKLEFTRKQVRGVYNSIVTTDEQQIILSPNRISFSNKKRALDNYKYLQTGQGLLEQKQFDKRTMSAFQQIEDKLLLYLEKSFAPDVVLENFVRIIKSKPLASIWYTEMEDELFFNSFLRICETGQKAVELILLDKSLGDMLLSRRAFTEIFDNMESFTLTHLFFFLSVQFRLGIINSKRLTAILSQFVLRKAALKCSGQEYKYFVAGLGSFAAGEMTFSSDIDLIFIVENLDGFPSAHADFQNYLAELKKDLHSFEIDCRLRPEGKNSPLVWDISSYDLYLEKRAQFWELQAFTRIQFICGSKDLYNSLLQKVLKKIEIINKQELSKDIINMRQKIDRQIAVSPQAHFGKFFNVKKSKGGLIDIEYAVQYLILTNPGSFLHCAGRNISEIIEYFKSASYNNIKESTLSTLERIEVNYNFLKEVELNLQVILNTSVKNIPIDVSKKNLLARGMNFKDSKEFDTSIQNVAKSNIAFFDEVVSAD